MNQKSQNYYEIYGIPRTATSEQIQAAWQKLTLLKHPDINKEAGATAEMAQLNSIKKILLDPKTRREYDLSLPPEKTKEGKIDMEAYINSLMKNLNININDEGSSRGKNKGTNFTDVMKKMNQDLKKDFFLIPENDYGLLYALRSAYGAKKDGEWIVTRSENDKRDLPRGLYKVIRENGEVIIKRSIVDWRRKDIRNNDIEINLKNGKETVPFDTLFSEKILCSDKTHSLFTSNINRPLNYKEYLDSIKSIAQKIAFSKEGEGINVENERNVIKKYAESFFGNFRVEGTPVKEINPDNEFVPKVTDDNFYEKLRESGSCVTRVEKTHVSKEGASKGPFSGGGESRG